MDANNIQPTNRVHHHQLEVSSTPNNLKLAKSKSNRSAVYSPVQDNPILNLKIITEHASNSILQNSITTHKSLRYDTEYLLNHLQKIHNHQSQASSYQDSHFYSDAIILDTYADLYQKCQKWISEPNQSLSSYEDLEVITLHHDLFNNIEIKRLPSELSKEIKSTVYLKEVNFEDHKKISSPYMAYSELFPGEHHIKTHNFSVPILKSDTLGGYINRLNSISEVTNLSVSVEIQKETGCRLHFRSGNDTESYFIPHSEFSLCDQDGFLDINGTLMQVHKYEPIDLLLNRLNQEKESHHLNASIIYSEDNIRISFTPDESYLSSKFYIKDMGKIFFTENNMECMPTRACITLQLQQWETGEGHPRGISHPVDLNFYQDDSTPELFKDKEGRSIAINPHLNRIIWNEHLSKPIFYIINKSCSKTSAEYIAKHRSHLTDENNIKKQMQRIATFLKEKITHLSPDHDIVPTIQYLKNISMDLSPDLLSKTILNNKEFLHANYNQNDYNEISWLPHKIELFSLQYLNKIHQGSRFRQVSLM